MWKIAGEVLHSEIEENHMVRMSGLLLALATALALATGCDLWGGTGSGTDNDPDTTTPPAYSVGDTGPAGGIVIYVDLGSEHSWTFLEAWTADEGTFQWKTSNTSTEGTGMAIGTGSENTAVLAGLEHPAAQAARDASHGGFTDWFLPSRDELVIVRAHRAAIGADESAIFWSSSEHDAEYANSHNFAFPTGGISGKGNSWQVRVIRAF